MSSKIRQHAICLSKKHLLLVVIILGIISFISLSSIALNTNKSLSSKAATNDIATQQQTATCSKSHPDACGGSGEYACGEGNAYCCDSGLSIDKLTNLCSSSSGSSPQSTNAPQPTTNGDPQTPSNCKEKKIPSCVPNGYNKDDPEQQYNDRLGINKRYPMITRKDCTYSCTELNERAGMNFSYVYNYECYNTITEQFECYLQQNNKKPYTPYVYTPTKVTTLSPQDTVTAPYNQLVYCSTDQSRMILNQFEQMSSIYFDVLDQKGLENDESGLKCTDYAYLHADQSYLYEQSASMEFIYSCLDTFTINFYVTKKGDSENRLRRRCYYKVKKTIVPYPWPTIPSACKDLSQDQCRGECSWYGGCNKCADAGKDKNIVCGENGTACLSIKSMDSSRPCESNPQCEYHFRCHPYIVCTNKGMDDYFACSKEYRESQPTPTPTPDPNRSCRSLGLQVSLQPIVPDQSWTSITDGEVARAKCAQYYPEYTVCRGEATDFFNRTVTTYQCGKVEK